MTDEYRIYKNVLLYVLLYVLQDTILTGRRTGRTCGVSVMHPDVGSVIQDRRR